jgi:predicted enzyme related to lactoylglutathione lyase
MTQSTQLLRSASYFPVADVARSVTHYEQVLGFRAEYAAGTPPVFAILSRDGLAVMLRLVAKPELIRPSESQGGTWDVFFWVRDADGLHQELAGRGATVVYPPTIQAAYQMKEFAIRDCDGHVLGFGEAV